MPGARLYLTSRPWGYCFSLSRHVLPGCMCGAGGIFLLYWKPGKAYSEKFQNKRLMMSSSQLTSVMSFLINPSSPAASRLFWPYPYGTRAHERPLECNENFWVGFTLLISEICVRISFILSCCWRWNSLSTDIPTASWTSFHNNLYSTFLMPLYSSPFGGPTVLSHESRTTKYK
jgi:hypothetical protein